jgi:hypothetical protein
MPPTETDTIQTLLAQAPHPGMIESLEVYLDAQMAGTVPYSPNATRMLIKLYHIFPHTLNKTKVGQACMLGLTEFPQLEVLACSYMIPASVWQHSPCSLVHACVKSLEACHFVQFWKDYEGLLHYHDDAALSKLAQASVGKLQRAIVQVLALTYKSAPVSMVLQAVHADSVDVFKGMECVERVDSESVTFVSTVDNTKRQRVYQERVNFQAISSLMSKMAQ